jgi:flavin reductase (DIM6/NTAB) family NADH-FMN oxidoreductase RutF
MSAVLKSSRSIAGGPTPVAAVSEGAMNERRRLRHALGSFATGVAVVTTRFEGVAHGLTINSFASVSLDPPLVLWSLDKRSHSLEAFSRAEGFVVHVLARGQAELAITFARHGVDRFAGVEAVDGLAGAPVLADCAAVFECRRTASHEGGDHLIFIGEVARFASDERAPLVFSRGAFGGFAP